MPHSKSEPSRCMHPFLRGKRRVPTILHLLHGISFSTCFKVLAFCQPDNNPRNPSLLPPPNKPVWSQHRKASAPISPNLHFLAKLTHVLPCFIRTQVGRPLSQPKSRGCQPRYPMLPPLAPAAVPEGNPLVGFFTSSRSLSLQHSTPSSSETFVYLVFT